MENSKDYKGVAVKDVETGSDLRKRAWVMVINNYTEKDEAKFRLMASKATYAIFGREVAPTTGTKHMQCFMYFGNKRRWTTLHKFFDNAWIAPARGTPQQNFVYCSEDGDYEQYGELPTQGRAKYHVVVDAMEDPEENFHTFHQYHKSYQEHQMTKTYQKGKQRPRLIFVDFFWQIAQSLSDDCYVLNTWPNGMFSEYNGEKEICINCEIHELEGVDLITITQWVEHGITPRFKNGYLKGKVTATTLIICSIDKYKKLSTLKSFVTIEEDGETDL